MDLKKLRFNIPIFLMTILSLVIFSLIKTQFGVYTKTGFYFVIFVSCSILCCSNKIQYVYIPTFFLLIITRFTITVNFVPEHFFAGQRWFAWSLILIAVGPLFSSVSFYLLRIYLFKNIMTICQIIGAGSFFWFILGLPNLGRGFFSGLTYHSMTLGPVAAIGAISLFIQAFHTDFTIKRVLYFALASMSFVALLLASSRVAIVAFIFALLIFLVVKFKQKLFYILLLVFPFGVLGLPSFQFDTNVTEGLQEKGDNNTRAHHWDSRIKEFKANPIFGTGFATLGEDIVGHNEGGGVEPGSSWLYVLSSTGVMGMLSLLTLLVSLGIPLLILSFQLDSIIPYTLLAILCFFMVHLVAEGYVYASGSPQGLLFWLTLGRIMDIKINYKTILNAKRKLSFLG